MRVRCHSEYFSPTGVSLLVISDPAHSRLPALAQRDWLALIAFYGSVALIAGAIFAPRAAATLFPMPIGLALGALLIRPDRDNVRVGVNALMVALIVFSAFGMLSALWSVAPLASLSKPLYLLGAALGIGVFAAIAAGTRTTLLQPTARGLMVGLFAGALFLCFETLTDQAFTRFLFNHVSWVRIGREKNLQIVNDVIVKVGENEINRRATVVTMLLMPAFMMVLTLIEGLARRAGLVLLAVITAILMGFSGHQSSQAAIAAGAVAFGMALISPVWTRWLIGLTWCVCCLLIVPIVTSLHATDIHKNPKGLFFSARHRVVIWNTTAEQVKLAPWLGIGADATAAKTEARDKNLQDAGIAAPKDGQFDTTTARHAHNVYLQVWYELGAAGAVLFTAIGLAALALIGQQRDKLQPFLLAQFAAVAAMIAFSFSLWQLWFLGAIGFGVLNLLIGAIAFERAQTASSGSDAARG